MRHLLQLAALIVAIALLAGCGMSPEEAQQELSDSGIEYSEEAFVEQAAEGNTEAVELFLAAGMDPDAGWRGVINSTSISEEERLEVVGMLLSAGADQEDIDLSLLGAAMRGHTEVVRILLETGADPNAKQEESNLEYYTGKTALIAAAEENHAEIVKALLEAGADPDLGDESNKTALIIASERGCAETVRALLEGGADPNAKIQAGRNEGGTALMMVPAGMEDAEDRAGADNRLGKDRGCGNYPETVETLLEAGADPNVQVDNGQTPLIWAAFFGQVEIVELLLEAGADPRAENSRGRSALDAVSVSLEQIERAGPAQGAKNHEEEGQRLERDYREIARMLREADARR